MKKFFLMHIFKNNSPKGLPAQIFLKRKFQAGKGFSLLEVLIALSILSIGLVSALSLINSSIGINEEAHNRLVASMLLDDAFNHIRNIRDSNLLKGISWDDQIDACVNLQSNKKCILGYDEKDCFTCNGKSFTCGDEPPQLISVKDTDIAMYYNRGNIDSLNYYQIEKIASKKCFLNDVTAFTRIIEFEEVDFDHVKSTVTVTWSTPEVHSISFTSDLYNVQ